MFKIMSICLGGGYRYCRTSPPHPKRNAKGLYPLHRVIVENRLGRLLLDSEDVHHIDENKSNDSPDNLTVIDHCEHARHHHSKPSVLCSCPCGKQFSLRPFEMRRRTKRSKSGAIYCSLSCGTRFSKKAIAAA